jgi:hypothetical protein
LKNKILTKLDSNTFYPLSPLRVENPAEGGGVRRTTKQSSSKLLNGRGIASSPAKSGGLAMGVMFKKYCSNHIQVIFRIDVTSIIIETV